MPETMTGTRATNGTEWSLFADASGPTSQTTPIEAEIWIDTSGVSGAAEIVVRQYEKVRASDTQRQFDEPLYVSAGRPIVVIPLHLYRHGYDVTVTAITGTPTVTWSIRTPGA